MARIVVSEFLTLDGVMQAPGGEDEDRSGGFEHGGWQGPYFDDAAGRAVDEAMSTTDALLLGRRTYDIFAAYWPTSTEEPGLAERLNKLPVRDLLVFGSGGLVQTLMEHDLIDEYRLMFHPIVLGSGKRLFRDGNPKTGLRLVDSVISSTGTLIVRYAPERPK